MKRLLMFVGFTISVVLTAGAQNGEVIRDTLFVVNDVNRPVEFSKAIGKYLYIKNIIPSDLPEKARKVQIISSISTELDMKLIQIFNNSDILVPLSLFTEKYYTLYIKKNNATILTKKLIIR